MSNLLIDLVRCYSPSTQEQGAVETLVAWMRGHGFEARIDAAGNACGVRGNADAPNLLLLLGHIDTYPGEIPVRVEDGILYGRGSVDAKGSLCAFTESAATAEIPSDWRVMVVGAVEEECATSKGARYIRETIQPQMCVIGEPSGAGRITLGYKGRLNVEYRLHQSAAHSARPEPSAAARGVAFWNAVSAWAQQQNDQVERYFDQVQVNLNSINSHHDPFEASVDLAISFRLPPRLSPEQTLTVVTSFVDGGVLTSSGAEYAYLSDKNNPLVRGMLAAIRAHGVRPDFVLKTGTSDMNVVGAAWSCPMIAYGPGDSNLDHTPNEHLPLAEYDQAVRTLRYLIEHL